MDIDKVINLILNAAFKDQWDLVAKYRSQIEKSTGHIFNTYYMIDGTYFDFDKKVVDKTRRKRVYQNVKIYR